MDGDAGKVLGQPELVCEACNVSAVGATVIGLAESLVLHHYHKNVNRCRRRCDDRSRLVANHNCACPAGQKKQENRADRMQSILSLDYFVAQSCPILD